MIEQARLFAAEHYAGTDSIRIGVSSALGPVPAWKDEADFLFAQVGFSWGQLLRWREAVTFNGPVYAGVMVVASAEMGRKLSAYIPQLAIPDWLVARLADDPSAGVDHACEMLAQARESDAFAGVHLIPVRRYREVAQRLEARLRSGPQPPITTAHSATDAVGRANRFRR